MYFIIKTIVSALLISLISYIGKKYSFIGGVLASLPLTSILAFIWMYHENTEVLPIINLSYVIFWMVLPSVFFFLCLPLLLKSGMRFYLALGTSMVAMAIIYTAYVSLLKKFGIQLS